MGKIIVDGVERDETASEKNERELGFSAKINSSYTLDKSLMWERMSKEEAEKVMSAKGGKPAKFRGVWDDSPYLSSDSDFFTELNEFLSETLSAGRATEILKAQE